MKKLKLLVNHIKQHKERTLILFLLSIGLFYAGLTTSPYILTPTLLCIYLGYVASQIKRIENISQIVDEALKLSKQGDASEFLFAHAIMLNLLIPSSITTSIGILPLTLIAAIGSTLISINATYEKLYYRDIVKKLKENDPSATHLELGEYHHSETLHAELSDALKNNYTLTSYTIHDEHREKMQYRHSLALDRLLSKHCDKNRSGKKGLCGLHFFSSISNPPRSKVKVKVNVNVNEDIVRLVGEFIVADTPKRNEVINNVITRARKRALRERALRERELLKTHDTYDVTSEKTPQAKL